MLYKFKQVLLSSIVGLLVCNGAIAQNFLPDDQAFKVLVVLKNPTTVDIMWSIAPGYHMYRNAIGFETKDKNVILKTPIIPKGEVSYNKALDMTIEQYQESIHITLPIESKNKFNLILKGQGCADAGLCYAPFERTVSLDPTLFNKTHIKK